MKELVRQRVEEVLISLLDAEADLLTSMQKSERTESRQNT